VTLRAAAPSLTQLPEDAVVAAADVARYLGVSSATIMRSDLPRFYLTPRTPRFRVGDIRRWIAEQVKRGAA
jgi:hypothetical protein